MSTPGSASPLRILLVDDSPLIRLGLRAALEGRTDMQIVGEAGTAAEGVAAAERLKPAIVLLDLRLPDKPGFAACREIVQRLPSARVLILTSSTDERNVQQAITAGAYGYLLKENDSATLANAILHVAAGRSVLDPSLANQVVRLVQRGPELSAVDKIKALSFQEQRVVALLTEGRTNKEIGDKLGLTEKTVKNYLATIFDKLGIARRAQAAALYTEAQRESL
ncbi:MAG: response regulator transcription factor [Candidatus Didemnitutus sp.]|nr:response regulator transcription factor [Candidatus Didemnitutus sp.]MCM2276064.1 response regulator transcription factor [Candidatus Didemnitutus sp.]